MSAEQSMSAPTTTTGDPRRIRALTHPVRLSLLDALALHGPLTATEAGARIGETATTCSFHLRQLARYGFVVDAGEPGRRERPWRLVDPDIALSRGNTPGAMFAASGLEALLQARAIQRWEQWQRHAPDFPDEWQQASPVRSWVVYMTPAELGALDQLVVEHLRHFVDRDDHPTDAVAVQITMTGHPVVDVAEGEPRR